MNSCRDWIPCENLCEKILPKSAKIGENCLTGEMAEAIRLRVARSVEVNPASRDISTSHMLHDVSSAELQGQHFQPVWSFQ